MKTLLLLVTAGATAGLTACMSAPATDPQLDYDAGPWFVGETHTMHVEWPQEVSCNNSGWNCDTGPLVWFQLDKVTCTGCTTSGVQIGQSVGNATSFDYVATTTDAISIEVDLSSDGEQRHLVASSVGDREIGLVANCDIVNANELEGTELPSVPCGGTRTADDFVAVDWYIHTLRGERIPFCPDDAISCDPDYPRKTSMIQLTPAPQQWWADQVPIYTSLDASTRSITMTAPLADGTLSSATIAVPPLQ